MAPRAEPRMQASHSAFRRTSPTHDGAQDAELAEMGDETHVNHWIDLL